MRDGEEKREGRVNTLKCIGGGANLCFKSMCRPYLTDSKNVEAKGVTMKSNLERLNQITPMIVALFLRCVFSLPEIAANAE